ncbi:transcription termination/antitermination protein NusA, partial [Campylobacter coli]|nr:transcription termination/antitermination protein NusA [Campylobacter coli]EKD6905322.1 transcription termination/antitermination protein NusA [Campylobacter coli]
MERIADIIESIANEKNLDIESVKEKVIIALINTAKRIYGQEYDFFVDRKNLNLYQ